MIGTPVSDHDAENDILLGELAVFFAELYAGDTRVSLARAILRAAFDAHEDTVAELDLLRARLRAANADLSELLAVQAASNASRSPTPSPTSHPKRPAPVAHTTPLIDGGPRARAPWPSPDASPERPTTRLRLLRSSVVGSPASLKPARRVTFSTAPASDVQRAVRPHSAMFLATTHEASGREDGESRASANTADRPSGPTSSVLLKDAPGPQSHDAATAAPTLLHPPATLLPIVATSDTPSTSSPAPGSRAAARPAQRHIRQRPRSLQLDLLNAAPPRRSEFEDDEPLTPRPRLAVAAGTIKDTGAVTQATQGAVALAPLPLEPSEQPARDAGLNGAPGAQAGPDARARIAALENELAAQTEALGRTEAALVRAWDRAEQLADAHAEMEVELGAVRAERESVRVELDVVRGELARAELALALRPSEELVPRPTSTATRSAWLTVGGVESPSRTRQRSMKWVGDAHRGAQPDLDAMSHLGHTHLAVDTRAQDMDAAAEMEMELAAAHECVAQLEARVESAERDARRARGDVEVLLEERDSARIELGHLEARVLEAQGARDGELVAVVGVVISLHVALRKCRKLVAQERHKSQDLFSQLTTSQDELPATQTELSRAQTELTSALTEMSSALTELSATQAELRDTQQALLACSADLDAHTAALHEACLRLVDQGRLLAERDVQIAVLTAEWLVARCEAQAAGVQLLLRSAGHYDA